MVLESMYPTIDEAVADRLALRFGVVGASLAAPLLWQLPLRIGISTDDLRPIDHIARFGAPVLFASGAEDRHTTWSETQRLFNAAVEPKAIWRVDTLRHSPAMRRGRCGAACAGSCWRARMR